MTIAIHSKMETWERDTAIRLYKAGKIQAVAQVNILSIGFDYPEIDLIAILRPTKSYVIHVQIPGRGLRIAEGKTDCLVLDYAGNFKRLGPIDSRPNFPKRGKNQSNKIGRPLMKECPMCDELVPIAVKKCTECDYEFPEQEKLSITASGAPILEAQINEAPTPIKYTVTGVFYGKYQKQDKPPTLKVTYKVPGLKRFPEWVGLESPYAHLKAQAQRWWKKRSTKEVPNTVDDALKNVSTLQEPAMIEVDETNKFPKIIRYFFNEPLEND